MFCILSCGWWLLLHQRFARRSQQKLISAQLQPLLFRERLISSAIPRRNDLEAHLISLCKTESWLGEKVLEYDIEIMLNTLADYSSLFLCIDVEVCAKGAEIIFISKTRHLIAKENKHKTLHGSFCFIYYSLAWIATPRVKCALCCCSCYMLVLQIGF